MSNSDSASVLPGPTPDSPRVSKRVVTVVQARMGSSRLPGKVLLGALGQTFLQLMIERLRRAKNVGQLVVATSVRPEDNAIVDHCQRIGVDCFRGDPLDLLDRHYQVGLARQADAVVKIPSDCPLIDPAVVDRVIGYYLQHSQTYDFVSNLHPPTYPDGQDVEVMSMVALSEAWREAKKPLEREHCTPFIWDQPGRFRIANLAWESGLDYSMSHRWTLDYPEDAQFLARVFEELYPGKPTFSLEDVLELLERRPEITALNQQYCGVNWYRNHLTELKTIDKSMTRELKHEGNEKPKPKPG